MELPRRAVELSGGLKARHVSAVELAQDAIGARIERSDDKIKRGLRARFRARARRRRGPADAALARGETRPLLGLPL